MKTAIIKQIKEIKIDDSVIGLKVLMQSIQHSIEDVVEYYTFEAPENARFSFTVGTLVSGDWHYVENTTFERKLDSNHPLVTTGSLTNNYQIERNEKTIILNEGEKAQIGDIIRCEGIRRNFAVVFDSKLTFS